MLVIFGLSISLLLMGCPNPFGYYPNAEDRYSDAETGESSLPSAVSSPYFMARTMGSSGSYSIISGTSANFAEDQEIIIGSETDDATFYYTNTTTESTDPNDPNPQSSSTYKFSSALNLSGSSAVLNIKAMGIKALMYPSSLGTLVVTRDSDYTSDPTFNLAAGTYDSDQSLEIYSPTSGASLWYELTTDGSPPADPVEGSSTEYTGPLALSVSSTTTTYRIKVLATATNYFASNIVEATFVLDPFTISTAQGLANIASNTALWSGDFTMVNDIDISGYSNWTPIGTNANNFTGTFDGGGYTISGLTINSSSNFQGLFGFTDTGVELKNISLSGVNVIGGTYVGALIGLSMNSTIDNCQVISGSVTGTTHVGGLVGINIGTLSNSSSAATVTSSNTYQYVYIGGLSGYNTGTVSNSYATGNVASASIATGGTYSSVGGLIGYSLGDVMRSYSTGTVSNSFYDTSTPDSSGATSATTADMKGTTIFATAGWDFASTWASNGSVNDGYPYLQ